MMPSDPTAARPRPDAGTEEQLLRDALGDIPLDFLSREPLGAGSVAGFALRDADPAQTYYVDTSRIAVEAETGFATGADPARPDARIWLHPADPHLPALAPVAYAHAAEVLLQRLGITATAPGVMTAYRPGRRAVLRIPTPDGAVWVKIVRPGRIARIVEAHAACVSAGLPVPTVLGWSPDGLLVLSAAEGVPALDAHWQPAELLESVDRLRAQVRTVETTHRGKPITDRLSWYETHVEGHAGAVHLVRGIRATLAAHDAPASAVAHGDLHLGQLFLTDGSVTGLIDVDTLGAAHAAEDPAAFLSHAIASAALSGVHARTRLRDLADAARERWGDDPMVGPYAAIHLLGHAIAARDIGDTEREEHLIVEALALLPAPHG